MSNKCGLEFNDDNISAIADTIASKVIEEHKDDFKHPNPIKNKTMPWTLSTQEDIREFVEDILRKNNIASRDGATALNVESKDMSSDRIAWWENNTGTYVVYNPDEDECGSAFRPSSGKEYYDNDS